MKTNDAVTKLCNVAPYMYELVTDIKNDDAFIKELKSNLNDRIYLIFKVFPKLLKINPTALYSIIGEIFDKSADEVAEQPIGVTLNEIKQLWEDEDIKSFFSSYGNTIMEKDGDVEK